VTKLRKMKWLVYVEHMEDERPASWIRTDSLLRLHNSASNESSFLGKEERQEGMTKSRKFKCEICDIIPRSECGWLRNEKRIWRLKLK
jgi:hypothetical protein